jgi:NTE family protein
MNTHSHLIPDNLKISFLVYIFFIVFFFTGPVPVIGQELPKRPSVGLALSGGGAHGIAHLGVIKVMEEAGLRPDYISGVSMGSIIGGLYALGYSADSIMKILKSINWKLALSNNIPENKVSFLEKDHFNNNIFALPLSSRNIIFPSGIINGQQFENILSYYTWPAAEINDFSKLPIPFMCLATDIITYRKVELKSGYLADAIRASASIPSVFTPLKIDNHLLLDGGLIRNFAPAEVRNMGADIVIGSYVGFHAYSKEELQSVSGIIKQIAMFRSLDDFEDQKSLVDVLIRPETHGFPMLGFENTDSLFKRGYEAALPYKGYFRKLADSLNKISPQKPIENILNTQSYAFKKIEINGNKLYSNFQILGVLDISPGENVDKNMLSDRIELLYGKTWFDKVKYRIVSRNDSLILVIDCVEKPKSMLYASGYYSNSLESGIILGFSSRDLLTPRSEIKIKSYVGKYPKIDINLLQFIDLNQKFGASLNFYAESTLLPMFRLKEENIDVIGRNFTPGISFIRTFGLNEMMSVSGNYENRNLHLRYESDIPLKNLSYNYISATYDYKINSVDTKHFPNKGTILNISVSTSKLISGSIRTDSSKTYFEGNNLSFTGFNTFYGNFKHYFSPTAKSTFMIGGDALLITRSDSVSEQNNFYFLGGIESIDKRSISAVGFHPNEIPVRNMAGIRGEFDYEFIDNFHLNLMANIFAIQEADRNNGFSFLSGYGLGAGYNSFLGPLRIGIMEGNYKQEKFFREVKGYISFGYNFGI